MVLGFKTIKSLLPPTRLPNFSLDSGTKSLVCESFLPWLGSIASQFCISSFRVPKLLPVRQEDLSQASPEKENLEKENLEKETGSIGWGGKKVHDCKMALLCFYLAH